jgi:type IV pilus assembly protein PilY1
MKRISFFLLPSLFALPALAFFLGVTSIEAANTNADYSGVSPFVAAAVTPNVLMMLDNSGSMGYRAVCDDTPNAAAPYTACPTSPLMYPVGTPAGAPYIETVSFPGLFDSMSCYSYDQASTRFVATTTKAVVNTACGSADWDGNFLNWGTYRRHDALKKALIGGQCVAVRLTDASCPSSGSPSLITMKGEDGVLGTCCANASTAPITKGAGVNNANGRVPTAIQGLVSSASLVLNLRGFGTLPSGGFCVGRSNVAPPGTSAATCGIASSPTTPTNGEFLIHLVVGTEPTGVLQELGNNARFGLLEFRLSGDGGKVLVPIGSNQATPYNLSTVTTYTSNKAAMVAGVEQSLPATGTPLAETLYTGIRYIAQLPQPYTTTSYLYPIAFSSSGGPAFQPGSSQQGSLGPSEQGVLAAGETCPAGYIANACGRDPYFFGSSPAPGWASASMQVPCCKTFIMFLTDGEANIDDNIPAALQDYAHPAHGPHCTGNYTGPPASNPTSAQYLGATGCFNSNTNLIPPNVLMQKHKVDYTTLGVADINHTVDDVAYWGHINDLRQAIIPGTGEAGHDLPGFQNVTIYPVFAFGNINGRELLMQTAKQGGFEDQNGNNLPDLQSEWDKVNNDTGLLAPDGIPDTYFESQNANDIRAKLLSALTSLLQKSASGTSVSVLASSSTGEGAMYQAYFFPNTFNTIGTTTTEILWTGYTQGLFIDFYGNLREDFSAPGCTGPPDGKLVLSHDCIIKLRVDTSTGNVLVDRYKDDNGDGVADSTTPYQTVTLHDIQPIWEAGRRLALTDPDVTCPANTGGVTCRRILTWLDISNGGGIGPSVEEYNEFAPARVGYICPYLGGALALDCNSSDATNKTNALNEATNIINFVRGFQVSGLRDRQLNVLNDSGAAVTKVWKLGDIMNSTPVVVAAPRERYDVVYGDTGYSAFFRRYKDRRQVAYAGANDGMLHAFNAGFFTSGDDVSTTGVKEQVRFTTVPVQTGTSTTCAGLPCDASVTQYSYRINNPKLGAELWAFIPQDLLPQLRWLTMPAYDHMYYVDLTPKVTDVRIFAADADHPGGWGTILIGGFSLGGSCTNCTQGKSGPRTVNADFNYNGTTTDTGNATSGSDTRVFLSSYFVLDVTNPEKDPVLLWVFRDKDLGLTTAAPAVLRVNPLTDTSTSSANEKWYVVFGTGPTHIDGSSGQTAKMFVVDLKAGPVYTAINQTSGTVSGATCSLASPCIAANTGSSSDEVRVFSTGQTGSSMGNAITVDYQLDYRVDTVYAGTISCNGGTPSPCNGSNPIWRGAMYRLTTNGGDPNPDTWGLSGAPTKLISTFAYTTSQATTCANASPCYVGPVISTPAAALDDAQNLWIYFGTGRFYSNNDKTTTDRQHLFGVKDCIISGTCSDQNVERNALVNVSSIVVCTICSGANQVTGLAGITQFDGDPSTSLVGSITTRDGWFTTLPTSGERNFSGPQLLAGNVFSTTFVPTQDICASTGEGNLYALYYKTGTAYKDSVIGTTPSGSETLVNRSIDLGAGVPSQMAMQIGAQGSGAAGTSSGSGSIGRVTGFIQSSSGVLGQLAIKPSLSPWSRILAWRDM